MASIVQPSAVSAVVRLLPGPVLRALDAWSQRVARRRWEQRQQKWQERKAAIAAAATQSVAYGMKPLGD